jgi:hypothetical protein
VNTYGDFNAGGMSDVNQDWEMRQEYKFQTGIVYGDLEVERAALSKLNLVAEKQMSAAKTLDKFMDFTYHFGVAGLQNYGLLNDPALPAPLNPTTKTAGNANKWVSGGVVNALANEIYSDMQALFNPLSANSGGRITTDSRFKLVYPNNVAGALTAVNSFGITIKAFIKESFPNVEYVVDPRYATTGVSARMSHGISAPVRALRMGSMPISLPNGWPTTRTAMWSRAGTFLPAPRPAMSLLRLRRRSARRPALNRSTRTACRPSSVRWFGRLRAADVRRRPNCRAGCF